MKFKSQKGSVALFVLIALLFYMGFLLLLYANNLNKIQSISEKIEFIKSIYEKNVNNIDDVYNRRFAQNDNMQPIIKDIPVRILTNNIEAVSNNSTSIKDSYEEYGSLGGKTEYIAFDNTFSSLKEVVQYATINNLYGDCNIQINAYGNNKKESTKKQMIQILKGAEAKNENDLNTALNVTEPLYIRIENDIECANSIHIDNVSHQLDLNNQTVSLTRENESLHLMTIESNASLTIIDNSLEKNGTVLVKLFQEVNSDGKTRNNTITGIRNYGTLTIKSGKVKADLVQKMLNKREGTTVEDTCSAIENAGTVNLNGGIIESNIETQGAVYLAVKRSKANGRGITNTGTVNLNSGSIITNAVASMIRVSGATVWGKTYAYAYGILGSGTINDSNNVTFVTKATANTSGTYYTDSDNLNMAENSKIAVDDDDK